MTPIVTAGTDAARVSYHADDGIVYIYVDSGWNELSVTVDQARAIADALREVLT